MGPPRRRRVVEEGKHPRKALMLGEKEAMALFENCHPSACVCVEQAGSLEQMTKPRKRGGEEERQKSRKGIVRERRSSRLRADVVCENVDPRSAGLVSAGSRLGVGHFAFGDRAPRPSKR